MGDNEHSEEIWYSTEGYTGIKEEGWEYKINLDKMALSRKWKIQGRKMV